MATGDAFPWGRWEVWRPRSDQHATDALANWTAKASGADVSWDESSKRLSDNRVVHTVVPIMSCVKCHPLLDSAGRTVTFTCADPSQAGPISAQQVRSWEAKNLNYQRIQYWPNLAWDGRQYKVSIMICYRLDYLPIQDCVGVGPDVRAARADAARRLLRSGHCMIQLR